MLTFKAPAKINWFLKVCGLRDDGYHEVKSLIQKISLYDVLTFVSAEDLTLATDMQLPFEQNLVYKAAVLLKEECGVNTGAEICLYKNIPVSAGLGGGSSNAATTLVALNELWSLGLSIDNLSVLAERLGSDVPFFLHSPLAFVEGRGEKITTLKAVKPFNILLVKPPITLSTRWVYNNFRAQVSYRPNRDLTIKDNKFDKIKFFIHTIGRAKLNKNINFFNDLESVTIKNFPVIADIKDGFLKEGAVFSLMSGSGPSVFGVFETVSEAHNALKAFKDCWTAVVKTITD